MSAGRQHRLCQHQSGLRGPLAGPGPSSCPMRSQPPFTAAACLPGARMPACAPAAGTGSGLDSLLPRHARNKQRPKSPLDCIGRMHDSTQETSPACSRPHRPRRPLAVHVAEPGRPAAAALQHAALLAPALAAGAQRLGAARGGRGGRLAWGRRLLPAGRRPRKAVYKRRQQAASTPASFQPHLAASVSACLASLLAAAPWSSAATLPWPSLVAQSKGVLPLEVKASTSAPAAMRSITIS